MDPAKVRSQNVSGLNSPHQPGGNNRLRWVGQPHDLRLPLPARQLWLAAAAFTGLAAIAFAMYAIVMSRMDGIAASHAEDLTQPSAKPSDLLHVCQTPLDQVQR